jgi:hypothetical protein
MAIFACYLQKVFIGFAATLADEAFLQSCRAELA